MKFQNKKNGQVAIVLENNDKFKTVLLELEDGKTISIASSTFKRWWKKMQDEPAVTDDKVRKVTRSIKEDKQFADEALQTVDRVLAEKKLESIKGKLKKKGPALVEKALSKKNRKVNSELRDNFEQDVLSMLGKEKEFSFLRYDKLPHLFVVQQKCQDKTKTRFELRAQRKGYCLYLKYDVCDDLRLPFHLVKNYYLPAVVKVESHDVKTLETVVNYYKSKEEK